MAVNRGKPRRTRRGRLRVAGSGLGPSAGRGCPGDPSAGIGSASADYGRHRPDVARRPPTLCRGPPTAALRSPLSLDGAYARGGSRPSSSCVSTASRRTPPRARSPAEAARRGPRHAARRSPARFHCDMCGLTTTAASRSPDGAAHVNEVARIEVAPSTRVVIGEADDRRPPAPTSRIVAPDIASGRPRRLRLPPPRVAEIAALDEREIAPHLRYQSVTTASSAC